MPGLLAVSSVSWCLVCRHNFALQTALSYLRRYRHIIQDRRSGRGLICRGFLPKGDLLDGG